MSVTIEGIKGYEYQYKITVLFALIYGKVKDNKLFVEKLGSEDITFIDENNNSIEIQIKREKNELIISKLFEWLFHFQERSYSNNLLLRVKQRTSRCLFITRSRCNDETLIYLNEFPSLEIKKRKVSTKELKTIIDALKKINFKSTKLDKKRNVFRDDFIKNLNKSDVDVFIKNIMIWEQLDETKVDDNILNLLNKNHISQSNAEFVYLKLLESVKLGRDNKDDIIPVFEKLINKYKINKYSINNEYIERSERKKSINILDKSNFIFLTGISQCGKSELAKIIANQYIDKGFNSIKVSDYIQLEIFFNQNTNEDKIAIYEDPFGHIKPSEESVSIKIKINNLINTLPLNHKLIVTNRLEIINESFSEPIFDDDNTIDLTEDSNEVLLEFWKKFSSVRLNSEIIELVNEFIKNEIKDKIQVGQLEYLSKYGVDKLKDKSIQELISIARHNSSDISNDILSSKKEESILLGILSTCCSNTLSVSKSDLAFILSKDEVEYSVNDKDRIKDLFKKEHKFPIYKKEHTIKKNNIYAITYFEERGFIKINEDKISFSHPNYFEVGKNLFYRKSNLEQKLIIGYLKKVILCINPYNSLFACKQLYSIYLNLKNPDLRVNIKELMFLSTRSIFPSVEDYSTINLIRIIDSCNIEEKEIIIDVINRGNTDSGYLEWINQKIPFITKRNLSFRNYFADYPKVEIINKIDNQIIKKEKIGLYKIWQYVLYYKIYLQSKNEFKLNQLIINSLLMYDEVFIRKQVAKIFFSSKIENDEQYLIDKIFTDEHPTVVFYGIWGSFLYWNKQNEDIKKIIFRYLKTLFERKEISIRACNLMSTFSIDYSGECIDWKDFTDEEKIELWNIWGDLYPIFSKSLPPNVYINVGRFGNTMKEAMKYLTFDRGINIFNAWYIQIEQKIDNKIGISDYEMGIIDDLIDFTKDNYQIRKELLTKILTHRNSLFCLYNFKNAVRYWNKLSIDEKELIIQIINSNRIDLRWFNALLITLDIPQELQKNFIDGVDIYKLKPKEFIEKLPKNLISDALCIFYAKPYELEYLSSHPNDFWKKIINYILFYQIDPFFEICIKDFVGTNIWGSRTENFLLWRKICSNSNDLDKLLMLVLFNISKSTIYVDGTKEIMNGLIFAYKKRGIYNSFVRIISENIEIIQLRHKEDIFEYLGKDFIFKDLYNYLFPDFLAKTILEKSEVFFIDALVENTATFRFYYTYDAIKYFLNKDIDIQLDTKERILSIPNKINEIGEIKYRELKNDFKEDKSIKDWIF